MTKTEIAKKVVTQLVAAKAKKTVQQQVTNHTEIAEDNLLLDAGSWAVGQYVAMVVKPYSDKAVDITIDRYRTWKQNRTDKKNQSE